NTFELYSSLAGGFAAVTASGNHNLTDNRSGHAAALLNTGLVLLAGGENATTPTVVMTAELYTPSYDPQGVVSLTSDNANTALAGNDTLAGCTLGLSGIGQTTCNSASVTPKHVNGGTHQITGHYLADWLGDTTYAANAFILPSALNNNAGGFIFQNQGLAGTSGATAPVFPQIAGQTVADNTVTWLNVGLSNTSGSVISSHDQSSSDSTAQALTVNTQAVTLDAVTDSKTYDSTQSSSGVPTVRGGTGPLFPGDVGTQIFSSKDVLGPNASTLTATTTVKNGVTDVSGDY